MVLKYHLTPPREKDKTSVVILSHVAEASKYLKYIQPVQHLTKPRCSSDNLVSNLIRYV